MDVVVEFSGLEGSGMEGDRMNGFVRELNGEDGGEGVVGSVSFDNDRAVR